ncbi:glycosyltransferase [Spirillospora sp. CA-294931]|uniref:glycosyltransferase n=1 Tax=Spirillospora sp. CA-294931 TaxID=3240042 RepID=UPI003D8BDD57
MTFTAKRARIRIVVGVTILVAAGTVWTVRHLTATTQALQGDTRQFGMVYTLAAVLLLAQVVMCHLERPHRVTTRQHRQLSALRVVVLVPTYNEDEELLARCLFSLAEQTRRPDRIVVVDDGSARDYPRTRTWALAESRRTALSVTWLRTPNRGKRHAHGEAIRRTPEADIYLTVDSDAILDPHAIEEGLKPFARSDVAAVAGIVLAANNRRTVLSRFTDLWYVTSQLVDRSSLSAMGSVLVNSGPLAFYRAAIVRANLDSYLGETIRGRPVAFSDDSMLTLFALLEGRTVQQPTSFVFTAMPERVGHHLRQYVRWMRDSTIRSLWRARYLPLTGYAYWAHLARWAQALIATVLFVAVFLVQPAIDHQFAASLLLISILIGYAQGLRYLTIRRADESLASQLATWALAPVAAMWAFFVLRPVRWYVMATCLRTGWGTRADVEVSLTPRTIATRGAPS